MKPYAGDMAASLSSIVSNNYYEMFRGQISMNFLPKYPIIAVSSKRLIHEEESLC